MLELPLWSVAVIFYHPDQSHTLCVTWKRAVSKEDAISLAVKQTAADHGRVWTETMCEAVQIPSHAIPPNFE